MEPILDTRPAPPPATFGTIPRNQFSVGRVIGRTFSAWRRHVVVFSLLTLGADVPVFVVTALGGVPVQGITTPNVNPFDRAALAAAPPLPPGYWGATALTMLLFLVEVGAITQGVIHHLAGRPVSLRAMAATGLRRFFPLLAVALLCYLMTILALVLLVVPGLYLACALAAALPAAVVERPGIWGAVRRSFALTKRNRLAVFAVFAVLFAVTIGVSAFGAYLLPALAAPYAPALGTLAGLLVNAVFGTLLWIAPAVVYHELRAAKEGIDATQLATVFE
jgi:hypothetical protein